MKKIFTSLSLALCLFVCSSKYAFAANLISNPSFDADSSGWSLNTGWSRSTADFNTSPASLRHTGTDSTAASTTPGISVCAGAEYSIHFLYNSSSDSYKLRVRQDTIATGDILNTFDILADSWAEAYYTFTPTSDTIFIEVFYSDTAADTSYFDDFDLELLGTCPSPIPSPSAMTLEPSVISGIRDFMFVDYAFKGIVLIVVGFYLGQWMFRR